MTSVNICIQAVKEAAEKLKAAGAKVERIENFIHQFGSTSIVGFVGNSEQKKSDYTGEYAAKISDAHAVENIARQEYKQAVLALVEALDSVSADAGRIIYLRCVEGLKMGNVAREMLCSRSKCYKILQNAGCWGIIKGPP